MKRWQGVLQASVCSLLFYNVSYAQIPKPESLGQCLERLGRRADCYFTVEEVAGRGASGNLLGRRVLVPPGAATLAEVVNVLSKALPDCKVAASDGSCIVRIVRSSKEVSKYWLDEEVKIAYNGSPSGLLEVVMKDVKGLAPTSTMWIGSMPITDSESHLIVPLGTRSRRDTLTKYLPLSDYRRALWQATTTMTNSELMEVAVSFGRLREERHGGGNVPFEEGEDAYLGNSGKAAVESAVTFIAKNAAVRGAKQVRWSLLFLGKEKAIEQMPVLFKYLGYNFCDVGALGEAYPAAKALSQIGEPAGIAALKELEIEKDAVRVRLLVYVVMTCKDFDWGKGNILSILKSRGDLGERAEWIRRALAEDTPVAPASQPEQPNRSVIPKGVGG